MTPIKCPICGVSYIPVLERKFPQLCVQDEFPQAAPWQREQLVSGVCSDECWDACFASPPPDTDISTDDEIAEWAENHGFRNKEVGRGE